MSTRKDFLKSAAMLTAGSFLLPGSVLGNSATSIDAKTTERSKWPDGTRLVISVSMQFEAGGEPETGFDSPFPANLAKGYTDLPAKTWFSYGYKE